jgi:hypothetical protein
MLSSTSHLHIQSGTLKIAEVKSRILDLNQFINFAKALGFTLKDKVYSILTPSNVLE